jgi:hypothetical protein
VLSPTEFRSTMSITVLRTLTPFLKKNDADSSLVFVDQIRGWIIARHGLTHQTGFLPLAASGDRG